MATREILDRIKRATVALAVVPSEPPPDHKSAPFLIIGSGFCVHPRGVVATCEHVISAFLDGDIREVIAQVPDEDKRKELWPLRNVRMTKPHALFFVTHASKENLILIAAPMEAAVGKMDCDLGLIRVVQHAAFKNGYPYLEIEDYANIYEGMDAAICGFPLGNFLQEQLGTLTSSFTKGILSSIIPSPGTAVEYVDGFQLDLTATFGNSGGPAFNWETGKVFGVLQAGVRDQDDNIVQGIARAEPIYKITGDDTLERLLTMSLEDIRKADE